MTTDDRISKLCEAVQLIAEGVAGKYWLDLDKRIRALALATDALAASRPTRAGDAVSRAEVLRVLTQQMFAYGQGDLQAAALDVARGSVNCLPSVPSGDGANHDAARCCCAARNANARATAAESALAHSQEAHAEAIQANTRLLGRAEAAEKERDEARGQRDEAMALHYEMPVKSDWSERLRALRDRIDAISAALGTGGGRGPLSPFAVRVTDALPNDNSPVGKP